MKYGIDDLGSVLAWDHLTVLSMQPSWTGSSYAKGYCLIFSPCS